MRIQLVGPWTLLVAVVAADSAAYALAFHPASAFLWYLNLDVFSLFRNSRAALGAVGGMPFAQALLLAGPIALLGLVGLMLRKMLYVAIASNLAVVLAAFVLYSWQAWGRIGGVKAASLTWTTAPSAGTSYLLAVLAVTSVGSFAASHSIYIRALRLRMR